MSTVRRYMGIVAALMLSGTVCFAKTIVMDATACERMAGISKVAPRQSWALNQARPGYFNNTHVVLAKGQSFLVQFPLDRIPAGHRIAHAELILPIAGRSGNEPRFYLWRLLADWGVGVSHLYRKVAKEKVEWTRPGAGGISSDRATRPTDVVRVTKNGKNVVNVTEDVELWYAGAADNNGWLLTVEDVGTSVTISSPVYTGQKAWKLRITYEPKGTE